jgi:hypothetical protein
MLRDSGLRKGKMRDKMIYHLNNSPFVLVILSIGLSAGYGVFGFSWEAFISLLLLIIVAVLFHGLWRSV